MALRVGLLSSWASRLGGGVFEAVRQQALALDAAEGVEVRVFALADQRTGDDRLHWRPVPVSTRPQYGPRAFGYAPGLASDLLAADLDVLHLHGIWMYPSHAAATWAARTGRPYVISPHGMLEPWIVNRGRWKKSIARAGYEERSWRRARLFHALTAAEAADIAEMTAGVAPGIDIVTVPNGVAVPSLRDRHLDGPPTVLYLGRIHPKKNLDALIAGWARGARPAGSRLVIAGWGETEHVAELETRLAAAADPSIAFVGPAHGPEKAALLDAARFLVLPSLSEGLPMTVLEAWAAGTPTLMTAACNLSHGFAAGAASTRARWKIPWP